MLKNIVTILVMCSITYSQSYFTFSDLQGVTDDNGKVKLFYRLNTGQTVSKIGTQDDRSIYEYEPETGIQNLFLYDGGWVADDYEGINDYEFWNNDVNKFIYTGYISSTEAFPFLYRFDKQEAILDPQIWSGEGNVELSRQDTSIIFVSFGNYFNYVSTDYGNTWNTIAAAYQIISVADYNHNKIFASDYSYLYLSADMGNTFDTIDVYRRFYGDFLYDMDTVHIYAKEYNDGYCLSVYNGTSWNIKYKSAGDDVYFTADPLAKGVIYIADGRNIYFSNNYGEDFSFYKSFNADITGIYKKSGNNILYITTKYDLYEVNSDSVKQLKHLNSGTLTDWYPLTKRNKWFYNYEYSIDNDYLSSKISWEVNDIVKQTDGTFAELSVLEKPAGGETNTNYILYLEYDTANQKVYTAKMAGDLLVRDVLIGDFSLLEGDTISTDSESLFIFTADGHENSFKQNSRYRTFYNSDIMTEYTFIRGIGLYQSFINELSYSKTTLSGAVINGVVYGDTLFTDVKPNNQVANEFSLSQNYPNPFNPETNIRYSIKNRGNVTLKVYDILGKEVATLVNEEILPGEYEVTFNGSGLASGVYIYRIISGEFSESKKLLLLK